MPPNDLNVNEYIEWGANQQHGSMIHFYRIPLKHFLPATFTFNSSWLCRRELPKKTNIVDDQFQWPEVLAAAMPSVASRFNPHPPESRLFAVVDKRLLDDLQRFKLHTVEFYKSIKDNTRQALFTEASVKEDFWLSKIDFNGEHLPTGSGTKAALCKIVESADQHFLKVLFRNLASDLFFWVFRTVNDPVDSLYNKLEQPVTTIITSDGKHTIVTYKMIHQLRRTTAISNDILNIILLLFADRDRRLTASYNDVHSNDIRFQHRKRSLFLPPECMINILQGVPIDKTFIPVDLPPFETLRRIYIVHRQEQEGDKICLFEIHLVKKRIRYHDPRTKTDEQRFIEMNNVQKAISTYLNAQLQIDNNFIWPISYFHMHSKLATDIFDIRFPMYGVLENECDAGIYMYAIIYYIEYGCPFSFVESDMSILRFNLSYWILQGNLPI